MRHLLIVAFVLVLTLAGATNAGIKQGDKELSIYGNFRTADLDSGDSIDITTFAGSLGYFVSDALEIGLVGSLMDISYEDESATLWGIGPNLKYHFGTQNNMVPYVGGQFLYNKAELYESYDGYLFGPLAGLKFSISDRTSLFVEFQYHLYGGDLADYVDNGYEMNVGISFLF